MSSTLTRSQPSGASIDSAARALPTVKRYLGRVPKLDRVKVRLPEDDAVLELPREAVELLAAILSHMAAGRAISVVSEHTELTTQQAAGMLNVSRPYLISLLDAGEIEYRRVGTHRRITAASLMEYKRKDDAKRRAALDDLAALDQEMGLI
uniref:Helix-turn-helix domain-containing protein n=1 Tax=Streptomyces sp. NBC_00049 TaxID=2903617 RepID=A0AAU2JK70_9ACTN